MKESVSIKPKKISSLEEALEIIADLQVLVLQLMEENKALKEENKELKAEIKRLKNRCSSNSSSPPSQDKPEHQKPNPKPASRDKDTAKKKKGGQKGHKAHNLKPLEEVEETKHYTQDFTSDGIRLTKNDIIDWEISQIIDIKPLQVFAVNHCRAVYRHPKTGKIIKTQVKGLAKTAVSYGKNLQAFILNLNAHSFVPLERTANFINDLTDLGITSSTVHNIKVKAANKLEFFVEDIKKELQQVKVLHADETGLNIGGKNEKGGWAHVYVSQNLAYFEAHKNRGSDAMKEIGILPNFSNILMTDYWASYRCFPNLKHIYCIPHVVRELRAIHEIEGNEWADELIKFFYDTWKSIQDEEKLPSEKDLKLLYKEYDNLLMKGEKLHPEKEEPIIKRGQKKRSKAQNLIRRLKLEKIQFLKYLKDLDLPFSNNAAERPIRALKVYLKVSGLWQNYETAKVFLNLRSFFETCRKNGHNIHSKIVQLLAGEITNLKNILV